MNFEGLPAETSRLKASKRPKPRKQQRRPSLSRQSSTNSTYASRPSMGSKRSKCLSRQRRGFGRAAVFVVRPFGDCLLSGCGRPRARGGDRQRKGRRRRGAQRDPRPGTDHGRCLRARRCRCCTARCSPSRRLPRPGPGPRRRSDQGDPGHGRGNRAEASELEPPRPRSQAERSCSPTKRKTRRSRRPRAGWPTCSSRRPARSPPRSPPATRSTWRSCARASAPASRAPVPDAFESGDEPPPGLRRVKGMMLRVTGPLYAIGRFCSRHH